jgi:hypothetical protein
MREADRRHVVMLAPMPLEMDAITKAFGLAPVDASPGSPWTGRVGESDVTAVHIGMGPPLTRLALDGLFDHSAPRWSTPSASLSTRPASPTPITPRAVPHGRAS